MAPSADTSGHSAVVTTRPKRKAASANINYKETGENDPFDNQVSRPSSRKNKNNNGNGNVNGNTSASASASAGANSNGKHSSKSGSNTKSSSSSTSSSTSTSNKSRNHSSTDLQQNIQEKFINEENAIPWNWQPPFKKSHIFNNILDLKSAKVEHNTLILADGFKLHKNDCIYMISEPPGEPYYIGRILGFTKKDKNNNTKNASNYAFQINWYYRPRDLNQKSNDSRLLYATMHNDICPLQSYRGLVHLKHKSEIDDLDSYKSQPNNFFFDKLYDRYMIRYYEVLPTEKLTNLPQNYYKALNKRFPYVFVELGRGKDLLADPKNCEKCYQWCSSVDSVTCVNCGKFYHMLCLDPPLMRKPQRGFGWSCASCNKDLEERLSEDRGDLLDFIKPNSRNSSAEVEEEKEKYKDKDKDNSSTSSEGEEEKLKLEKIEETNQTPDGNQKTKPLPKYELLAIEFLSKDKKLTLKQRRDLEEWPYRYLGVHARLEDALDLQDSPYARAASRLGSKHQASNIPEWYGHHLQYYDRDGSQRKKSNGGNTSNNGNNNNKKKNSPTPIKEPELKQPFLKIPQEFENVDPKDYPPWLIERPNGYIERGNGNTSTLMWKEPESESQQENVENFIKRCSPIAKSLNLSPHTPNFIDALLKFLLDNNYNSDLAFQEALKLTRDSLKEPTLTPEEIKKFEEAVKKYGSELYPVYQEVGTQSAGAIVRFYYLWKKTPNGRAIWGNYPGRAKNKLKNLNKDASHGLVDEVADSGDDSSYDTSKLAKGKRHCECKHCHTQTSLQWFRVSGYNKAPADSNETVTGLCLRCARLWRRYAVVWEEPNEVLRKQQQRGGNGWKRKIESELLVDCEQITEARNGNKKIINGANYNLKKLKSNGNGSSVSAKRKISAKEANKSLKKKVKEEENETKLSNNGKDKVSNVKKQAKSKKVKAEDKKKKILDSNGNHIDSDYILPNDILKEIKSSEVFSVSETNKTNDGNTNGATSNTLATNFSKLPLFDPASRPCCICRSNDSIQEILVCFNCGLNVHSSCYGIKLNNNNNKSDGSFSFEKKWACDVCSNDLNPVISTYYSCCLCPSRQTDYGNALAGNPNTFPDALKRTSNNFWCHVLCALFTEDIRFEDVNSLEPIQNTSLTLFKNIEKRCGLCNVKNGSIVKCCCCDFEAHITCILDTPNFFVGFMLEPCDQKDKNCIKINDFVYGIPRPTIICSNHSHQFPPPNFVPLRIPAKRMNVKLQQELPLISLYVQDFKKFDRSEFSGSSNSTAIRDRYFQYKNLCKISNYLPDFPAQSELDKHDGEEDRCGKCNTTRSLIFFESNETKLCYSCYSLQHNKNFQEEHENYLHYADNAKDLFKLVNRPFDPTPRDSSVVLPPIAPNVTANVIQNSIPNVVIANNIVQEKKEEEPQVNNEYIASQAYEARKNSHKISISDILS
ncbi:hypothetical protein PACTADRAFT_40090 [Pachysolen tannophilus NRRL Y-2460]|uniref:Uncharacterized protein n=1 Tax=Pachysolen tannophilus NRRL Y-2460 TaxID=669874 RepID=A0A1E4TZP7_PACTA|nr:hypothetical protein PACTADRAFT_40090 [Pachysolen tannophilus NRRL Y-2460]